MIDKGARTVALFCLGLAGVFSLLAVTQVAAGWRVASGAEVPVDLSREGLQRCSLSAWPADLPWSAPGPPEIWLDF